MERARSPSSAGYRPATFSLDSLVGSLAACPIPSLRWIIHDEPPIDQRIDYRSVRYFDCHGDRTCRACHREKPVSQLCQTLTTVREFALSNCAASSIEKANLVPFGSPIDTGKP